MSESLKVADSRPNNLTGEIADQEQAFISYLMNDTAAWLPETHAIFSTCCAQKIVHFLVDILSALQVSFTAYLGLDQMVTMDC